MGYILNFETLLKVVKELRKDNKIVYTHGAFDIFHYGHLEFLRLSKQQGQILVVGIDTDKTIKIYKGEKRPVLPLRERLNIMSRIDCVDFVFPIEYLSKSRGNLSANSVHKLYMNLYHLLKPNTVTYGRSYGGCKLIYKAKTRFKNTKFIKIIHEYGDIQSTTKIIDKILSSEKH